MGAATFTPSAVTSAFRGGTTADGKRYVEGVLALSASYATGGDTLALANTPLRKVDRIEVPSYSGSVLHGASGLSVQLLGTPSAPVLKAFTGVGAGAAVEVAAAVNLSGRAMAVRLVGS